MADDAAKIIVGVDLSETTGGPFEAALGLARDLGADLVLVHAFTRGMHVNAFVGPETRKIIEEVVGETHEDAAIDLTTEWAEQARGAGIRVDVVAEAGDAARLLAEQAQRPGVVMVVVGAHGHSQLHEWVLGSTAQRIIRKSPAPVLVVPDPR